MLTIVLGEPHEGPGGGEGLEVLLKIEISDELADELGGLHGVACAIHQGLSFASKAPLRLTGLKAEEPPGEPVGAMTEQELQELLKQEAG